MAYRRTRRSGIPGLMPAPLYREKFEAIDYDFLKVKTEASKELPFLTIEELVEELRKHVLQDELIIAQLMSMNYCQTAYEMTELFQAYANEHNLCQYENMCNPLEKDVKTIQFLAKGLAECEEMEMTEEWGNILYSRMNMARHFYKQNDIWLSRKILTKSLDIFSLFDQPNQRDQTLMANLHLMLAFFKLNDYDINDEERLTSIDHIKQCRELSKELMVEKKKRSYEQQICPYDIIQIIVIRPIAIHGWKECSKIKVQEIFNASNERTYNAATVLWISLILDVIQSYIIKDIECTNKNSLEDFNKGGMVELMENFTQASFLENTIDDDILLLFQQALDLASEGGNPTSLLSILYYQGKYFLDKGMLFDAKQTFLELCSKAILYKDRETLGLTMNRLGQISQEKGKVPRALEHFCNEWEIGFEEEQLPVLIFDSTKAFGKILLEEGQLEDAENCCRESYVKYKEIKSTKNTHFEKCEDDLLDEVWAMTGISAGISMYGHFSTKIRNDMDIKSLLEWKSYRKALAKVKKINKKPKTVQQASKHYDMTFKFISQKVEMIRKIDDKLRIPSKTLYEMYENWVERIEEDGAYQFVTDEEDYRSKVVIQSAITITDNMTEELQPEDSLMSSLVNNSINSVQTGHTSKVVSQFKNILTSVKSQNEVNSHKHPHHQESIINKRMDIQSEDGHDTKEKNLEKKAKTVRLFSLEHSSL